MIDKVLATRRPVRTVPIASPLAGIVSVVNVRVGQVVSPWQQVYEIVDLSTMWVHGQVLEPTARRWPRNNPSTCSSMPLPDTTFTGEVDHVGVKLDPGRAPACPCRGRTSRQAIARGDVLPPAHPRQGRARGDRLPLRRHRRSGRRAVGLGTRTAGHFCAPAGNAGHAQRRILSRLLTAYSRVIPLSRPASMSWPHSFQAAAESPRPRPGVRRSVTIQVRRPGDAERHRASTNRIAHRQKGDGLLDGHRAHRPRAGRTWRGGEGRPGAGPTSKASNCATCSSICCVPKRN